jgi:ribonuclease J
MAKTTITLLGGVNEIGGNKILLHDRNTKIFLDFGLSFSKERKFFAGYLCPRTVNGAGDYLEFGLLPNITGLYSKEALENTRIEYTEPTVDAVIVSHAHLDHVGHLPFIDDKIPVYCGEGTQIIIDAMEESSRINLGERKYKTFRTGKTIQVGSIEIEPVHVDHSIPAAYGFIIHTSRGTVAYTGDLRTHGPLGQMTWDFATKARQSDIDLMICEGTRVSPRESREIHSETAVRKQCSKVVSDASKLVIASFYSRDIDRFNTFHRIAKHTDRKLVIPIKLAHLLHKLEDDQRLKIPEVLTDDTIIFYKKRKRSGEFLPKDYYVWERPFLEKAETFNYVRKNQSRVIFNLDLIGFTELIDVKPTAGGDFIHSMSEPYTEEDIEVKVLHNWLNHFGIRFHQIHASGHCQTRDLRKVVDKIQPKKLIPIHTEHPIMFKNLFKKKYEVELAQEGEVIGL